MRHVFLGSPPFATPILERLLRSAYAPILVVTPPARPRGRGRKVEVSPVAALAEKAGVAVIQPPSAKDPGLLDELRALVPDVFLVASYGELLRQEFLEIPREVSLNVHPSLLPRHRGASPIQAAILAGDLVTGVSIQRVVLELDAGDVLVAHETEIRPGETAAELTERLMEVAGEAAVEALRRVDEGTASYTPQDPERVTFCKRMKKEDGRIDWTHPAPELERRVRALNPWPGTFTVLPSGKELFVRRARVVARPSGSAACPGELVDAEGALVVACGEREALELLEVQAAGKRALGAEAFQRGARLAPGTLLGAAE